MNSFIINLKHRQLYFVFFWFILIFLDTSENLLTRYWNDTLHSKLYILCLHHIQPLSKIFLNQFDRTQKDNNDNLAKHYLEFKFLLIKIPFAGQNIYLCLHYYKWKILHEITSLIRCKWIMRPKRIIKWKRSIFCRVLYV